MSTAPAKKAPAAKKEATPKPAAAAATKPVATKPAEPKAAAAPAPAAKKPAAEAKKAVEVAAPAGLYDSYEGEPAGVPRKSAAKPAAAKPVAQAASSSPASGDVAAAAAVPVAFQFILPNDDVEGKTNPQIKALLSTAFFGWGVIDETRLISREGDKEVTAFFSRPLGKGLTAREKIAAGEAVEFPFNGKSYSLTIHDGAPSGGGRSTKTANKPSEKKSDRGGRGGGRGGRGGRGGSGDSERGGRGGGRGGAAASSSE